MKAISKENKATTFYLYEEAKNKSKIRVLYKQNGKSPRVRIIPNVQILKRAIITRKLDIIPYQNVFLICNNQNYMKNTPINVVFDFFHISGDLLVVQINREKREFESLCQEDIGWFTSDLIYRSFNQKILQENNRQKYFSKKQKTSAEDNDCNFEINLLQELKNIELTIAKISTIYNTKK